MVAVVIDIKDIELSPDACQLYCTTVTSPEGKSICVQLSVQIVARKRMMLLDLTGLSEWVVGYMAIQSLLAIDFPRKLIDGSCSATRFMPAFINLPLLMRSC
jgi:hypothetical protein